MMNHPFKVRETKGADAVEFKAAMPTSIDETELIAKRYGTVERMIDRANSQWTVDVAVGVRKRLPNREDAQAYADGYCDNGSRDAFTRPKIDKKDAAKQGFTAEQIAFLEEKGMI